MKVKDKIIEEMQKIGFDFKYAGTYYILESILIISSSEKPFDIMKNIEKNVYEKIADDNMVKVDTIKVGMKNSIEKIYLKTDIRLINNYFFISDTDKLSAKKVIVTIFMHINRNKI